VNCPACGATAPEGAHFCPVCGQSLVTRPDERRIVTVLFGDLVGFTAFSETTDPERVKDLVDRCFAALSADVERYGGRVDKFVGDALVALFGAPIAHEDDAERAVRCALQMQRTVAQLHRDGSAGPELRIGVNTGEVLVGALRAGGDYTAMGDVVNTAQRLQTAALPGEVVVGAATRAATRGVVRYDDMGALQVKGREATVEAWKVGEVIAPPGTRGQHHDSPTVGREPELAFLRQILDTAFTKRRAHFVLLVGDAGVGKGRLAHEISEHARIAHHALVTGGRSVPYGEDLWWPIAETVRHVFGLDPDADEDGARQRILRTIARVTDRTTEDVEVVRVTNGLLYLLGHTRELADVDPARAREDALRSVSATFERIAAKRPLLIVLSELHWADDEVLALLDRLRVRLRALPAVIVATARREIDERWQPQAGGHNLTTLSVDPLEPAAVRELANTLLGSDATAELTELLAERSGGNPFFVEELAALAREDEGAADAIRRLPVTLQGLVAARLDTLPYDERAALEDCAIAGPAGTVDAVTALSRARGNDTAEPSPRELLRRLAKRDLIELDGDEFVFPSDVIREVTYATLTKAERARRHAALAQWLSKDAQDDDPSIERAAHHYTIAAALLRELDTVAQLPADLPSQAVALLERAASQAEHREQWPVAARWFDQAVRLLGDDAPVPLRQRLLLGRARAAAELRDVTTARSDLNELVDAAVDAATRARALTVRADLEQKEGRLEEAAATAEEALAAWRALGDERGIAEGLRQRGMVAMFRWDLDAADRDFHEALLAFRAAGDRRGEAWALQNLAWVAFYRADTPRAEQWLDASAEMFHEIGDWGGLGWARGLFAWVRFMQGRLDEAEQLARALLPETEESGNRWGVGTQQMLVAQIVLWKGRPEAALTSLADAERTFREIGDGWGIGQTGAIRSRALACAGRVDAALAAIDEIIALGPTRDATTLAELNRAQVLVQAGSRDALAAALQRQGSTETLGHEERMMLGLALAQAGRVVEALSELETSFAALPVEACGPRSAIGAALALVHAAAGQPSDGSAVVAELGDDVVTYLDRVWRDLAVAFYALQSGDPDAASAFDAAVDFADQTQARLEQAVTRVARAHAFAVLDHPDADRARADADARLAGLERSMPGWEQLFELAAVRKSGADAAGVMRS